jgi:hypothetical protein
MLAPFQVFGHSLSEKTADPLTANLYLSRSSSTPRKDNKRFEAFLSADEAEKTMLG